MKLTTVCTTVTSTGEMGISCLRCKRTINTKRHEPYVSGFWLPEKPFEPQGEGRSYMYACDKPLHHVLPCATSSVWGNPTEMCVSATLGCKALRTIWRNSKD